jgi:hypothetical protein
MAVVLGLPYRHRPPRPLPNLSNLISIPPIDHLSEQLLLSRQHQPHSRSDDRERITRARQAAEALFAAKPPVSAPAVPGAPPAEQSARKPRVLGIVQAAPVRVEDVKAPVGPEQQTPRAIPRSQFVRIRTWVKYGMTVAQVAEVYGVAPRDVERILHNI